MKYYLSSNDLYIEIPTLVFNQIKLQAEGEYPNENGGMLAGRYSKDKHTVYIEKVVVPVEKLTGRTKFMRITKGLENVWEQLAKEGLQYVGEWHSHPNGSTQYSSTDLAAMIDIEKEVAIENPLLLIVSVRSNGLSAHKFYCYMNNQLLEYNKMIDLKDLFHGLQNQMLASLKTFSVWIAVHNVQIGLRIVFIHLAIPTQGIRTTGKSSIYNRQFPVFTVVNLSSTREYDGKPGSFGRIRYEYLFINVLGWRRNRIGIHDNGCRLFYLLQFFFVGCIKAVGYLYFSCR